MVEVKEVLGWLAACVVLAACGATRGGDSASGTVPCDTVSDCPSGAACVGGVCHDGAGAAGGADSADAGASTGGGSEAAGSGGVGIGGASGAAAATGAGGLTGAGADGSGGVGGGSGVTIADNPFPLTGTGMPVECDVPALPPPTSSEDDARQQAIASYCGLLETYPCLSTMFLGEASDYAQTCDAASRVAACELDTYVDHQNRIPASCEDAWSAAIACATGVDYAAVCAGTDPLKVLVPLGGGTTDATDACIDERRALGDCVLAASPEAQISGSRADCGYTVAANNPGICTVGCGVDPGLLFNAECTGTASGGPFSCTCLLNGVPLSDDGFGYNPRFFGATCEDAAQRMADGDCVDRVDCCFTWSVGTDSGCACTSDPNLVGYATCEEAAGATGGAVVDLCPRYEWYGGGLNFERSSP